MAKSRFIPRLILVLGLLGVFGYAAFYLYNKQQLKLNYLSFQLENSTSLVVPDVDRFLSKIDDFDQLNLDKFPEKLKQGIETIQQHPNFSFNNDINSNCFISYNETDYVFVVNTSHSASAMIEVLNDSLGVEMTLSSSKLSVGATELIIENYGNYLAISTSPVELNEKAVPVDFGNADYIVFLPGDSLGIRHILSDEYNFVLQEKASEKLFGRAVNPQTYFSVAPAEFEEIQFYGSSRMGEDQHSFFDQPNAESFDWLDNGLLYCRQDSFELIIAKQGESRDLSLMLEEQTLSAIEDSALLPTFNIGKFKILPFKTTYNWSESIPNLNSELHYYTENQNFNVMTNSIPAMRWYLGLVQLGNLFESNVNSYKMFIDCLPEKVHQIQLVKSDSTYSCTSSVYQKNGRMLTTSVKTKDLTSTTAGTEVMRDIQLSIIPTDVQVIGMYPDEKMLLNGSQAVAMYGGSGEELWKLNLSSKLVEVPQIVDFENDGFSEFVLFQENQLDVVNMNGKSLPGFPVKFNGKSRAGLAVNYDNLYKYRLIVNIDQTVKVVSEEGSFVEGWMFDGMSAPIQGKIYHVLTDGKDIIAFKDENKVQYVLNRKGESRMTDQSVFSLKNETDFVIGGMANSLRKMGYKDGYMYNYYILDGEKDSVKVDRKLSPIQIHWKYNAGKPLMIAEESDRLLIVDQFGYVKSEVLKPNASNSFVGLVGNKDYGFVFADNSQNSIYLLNNFGKMMLPVAVSGSSVSIIKGDLLYTFSGISIRAYKI